MFGKKQQPVLIFLLLLGLFSVLYFYVSFQTDDAPYLENDWEYSWSETEAAPPVTAAWYFQVSRLAATSTTRFGLPEKPLHNPALYAKFVRQSYELYLMLEYK